MADIKLASNLFNRVEISQIFQIGCGGTGSLLVPHIARALSDINSGGSIEYVVVDGDKVEEKNIKRQNFVSKDVGYFKSDVLARRYSSAFGINISSMSRYISSIGDINSNRYGCLLVSCVDNNKTRAIIRQKWDCSSVWIDAGNELLGGQVFISGGYCVEGGMSRQFTDIMIKHPEMATSKDKLPTELSCAERVNSGEQSLGVNLTASTILFNVINSFIRRQKVYYYEIDFTAKNSFSKKMLDTY